MRMAVKYRVASLVARSAASWLRAAPSASALGQVHLELERALVLDAHEAADVRRVDPVVREREGSVPRTWIWLPLSWAFAGMSTGLRDAVEGQVAVERDVDRAAARGVGRERDRLA